LFVFWKKFSFSFLELREGGFVVFLFFFFKFVFWFKSEIRRFRCFSGLRLFRVPTYPPSSPSLYATLFSASSSSSGEFSLSFFNGGLFACLPAADALLQGRSNECFGGRFGQEMRWREVVYAWRVGGS
jgi:hypothetical protein